ncbi:MAG TPA: S4 domain-containing protein, partial [Propionibacteriaceae bacterium]
MTPTPRSPGPGRSPRNTPRREEGEQSDRQREAPGVDPEAEETEGVRLQKVLAAAGVASRRASEILIDRGRVEVNGHVVTEQG